MSMAKIMVVVGFLVAFAAGLTIGLESRQTSVAAPALPPEGTTKPSTRQGRGPGWLESELKLSAEQKKQMDKIWSELARGGGREEMDRRRRQFREERDQAILALVKPDDKPTYDAILQNYRDQQQSLEREMRANFENAVKQTNEILTVDQQAKYKELLSRHRPSDRGGDRGGERGGPGGPGHRGPGNSPSSVERNQPEKRPGDGDGATSKPASQL